MLEHKDMPAKSMKRRTALVLDGEAPMPVVVKATGKTRQTLVKWIDRSMIRGRKINGRWWVDLSSLKIAEI